MVASCVLLEQMAVTSTRVHATKHTVWSLDHLWMLNLVPNQSRIRQEIILSPLEFSLALEGPSSRLPGPTPCCVQTLWRKGKRHFQTGNIVIHWEFSHGLHWPGLSVELWRRMTMRVLLYIKILQNSWRNFLNETIELSYCRGHRMTVKVYKYIKNHYGSREMTYSEIVQVNNGIICIQLPFSWKIKRVSSHSLQLDFFVFTYNLHISILFSTTIAPLSATALLAPDKVKVSQSAQKKQSSA